MPAYMSSNGAGSGSEFGLLLVDDSRGMAPPKMGDLLAALRSCLCRLMKNNVRRIRTTAPSTPPTAPPIRALLLSEDVVSKFACGSNVGEGDVCVVVSVRNVVLTGVVIRGVS